MNYPKKLKKIMEAADVHFSGDLMPSDLIEMMHIYLEWRQEEAEAAMRASMEEMLEELQQQVLFETSEPEGMH